MSKNQHQQIASIEHVSKVFADKKALNDVSMTLYKGEVLAVLGPNGAGKTTLIHLMLGKLSTTSGTMSLLNHQPGELALKRQCGTMLQVSNLPDMSTVKEHIQLFSSYYANPIPFDEVMALSGLTAQCDEYTKNLSGGQKQRLLFALAICGDPQLLFLDEPSVAMDVEARKKLWAVITDLKNRGKTIVLTTHYLEEADQLADRIVMLNKGRIIHQGSPQEIKSRINRRTIRFSSAQPISQFVELAVNDDIERRGNFYHIHSDDPVATLKKVFAITEDIIDLSVSAAALEEAFILLNKQETS